MNSKGGYTEPMPKMIRGEEYLTAGEAAEYLGVSPATFLKWQTDYHLEYVTIPGEGQRKYFKKTKLDPIIEPRPGGDQK